MDMDEGMCIPSHVMVFQQMQDLVHIQALLATKLKCMVLRKENFVARGDFDDLAEELEAEKVSHLQTQAKLGEVLESLETSLQEIEALKKQLREEKQNFEKSFRDLKMSALHQQQEAMDVSDKYSEIEKICDYQDGVIAAKDSTIRDLKTRLVKQKSVHKHQISDMNIQIQQERYIAQNYLHKQGIASQRQERPLTRRPPDSIHR